MKITDTGKKVSLYSPYFDDMRRDLDIAITQALTGMEAKNISTGSIALKIDITTLRETVACDYAIDGVRKALIPNISYKVAIAMQAKGETKGNVVGKGFEIVQDETGAFFIVTKDEANGQLSLFNEFDAPDVGDDDE